MFVDEYDHEDDVNRKSSDEDEEDDESDEDTGTVQEAVGASGSSQGSLYDPDQSPAKKSRAPYPEVSLERMKQIVAYKRSGKKGDYKFTTVKNQFKADVVDRHHLRYMCKIVDRDGTSRMKREQIEDFVWTKFHEAFSNKCRIHDADIRRWALIKKREIGFPEFAASDTWIYSFKKRNRIAVRTITNIVSKKSMEKEEIIQANAKQFVAKIKDLLSNYSPSNVFNTDQSGFNRELHTRGTLAIIGTRRIETKVQSVNANTHSYTIQPLISMDGTLHSPMLIILQEKDGVFGPNVMKKMEKCDNLIIRCTRSGIVSKKVLHDWFLDHFFKVCGEKCLLLIDSLGSYKDRQLIDSKKPCNVEYKTETIPPHCTSKCQPCDLFLFRQWKIFVKMISDWVVNEDIEINLFHRDSIIILQSLIHNQFSSPRFKPFLRQSWIKAGYLAGPEPFVHPVDFCFKIPLNCSEQNCGQLSLIRCSHCEKILFFNHFFISYHVHL